MRASWRGALECNGNGLCFNFDVKSPMCPSMKITSNRIHSPKGRATLVREWLRLLADRGIDPLKLEQELPEKRASLRSLIERTRNSWHANKGEYDFSHEVKEAMSGCLACKACSTQCPIKIDVPEFRSRFLQLYHTRYLRPMRDHLVATVESYAPLMARAPKTFNFFINQPLVRKLSEKHIGMVDLPLLSVPSLQRQLVGHRSANMTLEQLEALSPEQKAKWCWWCRIRLPAITTRRWWPIFVRLAEKLGYQPVVLPFSPNGKAQHIKGFLNRFAKTAQKTSDFLNRVAGLGMPMVGVDPALVLCYRDEYKQTLGDKRGAFHVMLVHEWLPAALEQTSAMEVSGEPWYLFGHCTEVTALRAHLRNGPLFLPALARSLRASASVAAAWQALTGMK
ncbi:FAD-binding protein [Enterobacter cloacae]|uniref:FAD-binding protein n=1 Tax=Enterobacter cloacae TaxID=550 RepID=A0A377M295_ENTCL|nr:FAD-binding protein [Enterobacter cloacae]